MHIDWSLVVFVLLLLDSIGAVVVSWFGARWWAQHLGAIAIHFPPAKGWSAWYFLLVVMIGHLLGLY